MTEKIQVIAVDSADALVQGVNVYAVDAQGGQGDLIETIQYVDSALEAFDGIENACKILHETYDVVNNDDIEADEDGILFPRSHFA